MIRHLHPTDSPGLLQFRQSSDQGETCTLVDALRGGPSGFPTVKYASIALSPRAWKSYWVEAHRGRIDGVLRAGPRSGAHTWEVGELYLRNSKPELALDLLEQVAVPAARVGAHRIFIRIPTNSALFDDARRAGYSVVQRETVFRLESASTSVNNIAIPDSSIELRPRTSVDDHALFNLHNATTPIEVRMKQGQTTQDWLASSEHLGRKTSEWVFDIGNGDIGALVQRNSTRSGHMFNINWAAETESNIPELLAAALEESEDVPATSIVPEYRPALSYLLVSLGFTEQAQYEVMVKPIAQTVTEAKKAFATIN